jgi:hypothetical protein
MLEKNADAIAVLIIGQIDSRSGVDGVCFEPRFDIHMRQRPAAEGDRLSHHAVCLFAIEPAFLNQILAQANPWFCQVRFGGTSLLWLQLISTNG